MLFNKTRQYNIFSKILLLALITTIIIYDQQIFDRKLETVYSKQFLDMYIKVKKNNPKTPPPPTKTTKQQHTQNPAPSF